MIKQELPRVLFLNFNFGCCNITFASCPKFGFSLVTLAITIRPRTLCIFHWSILWINIVKFNFISVLTETLYVSFGIPTGIDAGTVSLSLSCKYMYIKTSTELSCASGLTIAINSRSCMSYDISQCFPLKKKYEIGVALPELENPIEYSSWPSFTPFVALSVICSIPSFKLPENKLSFVNKWSEFRQYLIQIYNN